MPREVRDASFGWNFMVDPQWLKNFITQITYEMGNTYPRESYQMGVWYNATYLYGLPERSQHFLLKDTSDIQPYRLYAADLFPHEEWHQQGLYSGIPYLTGHSLDHDVSLMWLSAAETWVDLIPYK
jgi:alpha-glucosidase (family GH31 glycosyl hydrolase)